MQFYANVDNASGSVGPSKVTYRIVPTGTGVGELRQTVQKPNSPTPGASGYQYTMTSNIVDTVVARNVRTDTGRAIFTYYDGSSARIVPVGGFLTATQLKGVLAIELQLTVQTSDLRAKPTTYVQRLLLPNAQAVIRENQETTP